MCRLRGKAASRNPIKIIMIYYCCLCSRHNETRARAHSNLIQINFLLQSPELASGTYDIVVRDVLYGYSNSISVTYSFSVDSVSPSSGWFTSLRVEYT